MRRCIMGFRFHRSVKILPGVKININKKSNSITFGPKGAHYTINSKGKRTTTVGIPGTGLSTQLQRKKSVAVLLHQQMLPLVITQFLLHQHQKKNGIKGQLVSF